MRTGMRRRVALPFAALLCISEIVMFGPVPAYAFSCGAWEVVSSPMADMSSELLAASADSPTDAWAVGWTSEPFEEPLAEHWDGVSWTIVPTPLPQPGYAGVLTSVVALSPVDAWTAGASGVEHWDGVSWTNVRLPSRIRPLSVGAIPGTSELWVVGERVRPNGSRPYAARWNGTSFLTTPTVDPFAGVPGQETGFVAVSALSTTSAVAAGGPLERWDGSDWRIRKSPRIYVQHLSMIASGDIYASGSQFGPPPHHYVWHLSGHRWRPVTGVPGSPLLIDVAALSSNDVWLDGVVGSSYANYRPVFAHGDGTTWSIVPSATIPLGSFIDDLEPRSANDVWAVGAEIENGSQVPLIMHYC